MTNDRIDWPRLGLKALALACLLPLPVGLLQSTQALGDDQAECANNLRMIGLATIQYGDDKRFMPHVERILDLDGDVATNHTPIKIRALVWYGYHDGPERFICPDSRDDAGPLTDSARENMRTWTWKETKGEASLTQAPYVQSGVDPTLDSMTDLSYGTTRKGMNSNVRSTAVLAADRAAVQDRNEDHPLRGNHKKGWNVLMADGAVDWRDAESDPYPGSYLAATTSNSDGYLAIRDQSSDADRALVLAPKKKDKKTESESSASEAEEDGGLCALVAPSRDGGAPLALLALLALGLWVRRSAGRP
jgi:hypothetical protein